MSSKTKGTTDTSVPPKHPLVALADHYYLVASDLIQQSNRMRDIAEGLNHHADRLCEQAIREKP